MHAFLFMQFPLVAFAVMRLYSDLIYAAVSFFLRDLALKSPRPPSWNVDIPAYWEGVHAVLPDNFLIDLLLTSAAYTLPFASAAFCKAA
jgi:hypothetical protein